MTEERKAYAKMRTGFNALMLEVEPSIVRDLLATFEEYVAVVTKVTDKETLPGEMDQGNVESP